MLAPDTVLDWVEHDSAATVHNPYRAASPAQPWPTRPLGRGFVQTLSGYT